MKTQNATVAAVERPSRQGLAHDNLADFCVGWESQAKNCPCNGCAQAPRCAREQIACRAWRTWLMTGRSVRHLERIPDAPIVRGSERGEA